MRAIEPARPKKDSASKMGWEDFCRERIRIIDPDGDEVPFLWNRGQRRVAVEMLKLWDAGLPVMLIIVKSRQWGCTTLIASFFVWIAEDRDNFKVYCLTLNDDSTSNVREMYDGMHNSLEVQHRQPKDQDSQKHGTVLRNGAGWLVKTAGTKATAGRVGRSKTMQGLHITEEAFWEDSKKTLLGAINTVHIGPYKVIIRESTCNGASGTFYETYKGAKDGRNRYVPVFVPWHEIDTYAIATTAEEDRLFKQYLNNPPDQPRNNWFLARLDILADDEHRIEKYGLTLGQWRWWCQTLQDKCEGDLDQMRQEYPDDDYTCFIKSGGPIFGTEHLDWLKDFIRDPKRCMFDFSEDGKTVALTEDARGVYRVWEQPEDGAQYILTADSTLGGATRDNSIAYVWKRTNGRLEQCAGVATKADPNDFAEMCWHLYVAYFKPLFAPETNNQGGGMTVLETMRRLGAYNIYKRIVYNVASKSWARDELGWNTNPTSRPMMLAAGKMYMRCLTGQEVGRCIVRDRLLRDEMETFIYDEKTGKAKAAQGKRDDRVINLLIAARVDQDWPMQEQAVEAETKPRKSEWKSALDAMDGLDAGLASAPKASAWLLEGGFYD